jgi:hypothetical protein
VHQLLQGWLPQAEATYGQQIVDPKNMALGLRDFFGRHALQDTLKATIAACSEDYRLSGSNNGSVDSLSGHQLSDRLRA